MGFTTEVSVDCYSDVHIENEDIINGITEEEDALIIVKGLLENFPNIIKEIKISDKLFPKNIRDQMIQKLQKKYQPIQTFMKEGSKIE
jgi:hypothetical protein